MAVYKCKACGANLEITKISDLIECEYCGMLQTVVPVSDKTAGGNAENLLKRGDLALEDKKWGEAKTFFDRVLDIDAEEPRAYIGKLLANTGYSSLDELWQAERWNKVMAMDDYKKAYRFSDENFRRMLDEYNVRYIYRTACDRYNSEYMTDVGEAVNLFTQIINYKDSRELSENCRDKIYSHALSLMNAADSEEEYLAAKSEFGLISRYLDSDSNAEECALKAELARKDAIYDHASKYENSDDIKDLSFSAKKFESIPDHKDSKEKAELLRARIRSMENEAEEARRRAELRNQEFRHQELEKQLLEEARKKKIRFIVIAAILLAIAIYFVVSFFIIPNRTNNEVTDPAGTADHSEPENKVTENKVTHPPEYYAAIRESLPQGTISAGGSNSAGVKNDGTIFYTTVGTLKWTDITAVSVGNGHIAGLKSGGTVVSYDNYNGGSYEVLDWTDIVAISYGYHHIIGLKSDGTVVTTGHTDTSDWRDIIAVSANAYMIGLKSDGTVVGHDDVSDWTDIVAVSTGNRHIVGLRSDGTVVTTGSEDVSDWTDIVAVSAGNIHTVGLKSDGTVVAAGANSDGQCDVSDWMDIVAVSADGYYTLGLRSDGTVVATGKNNTGQCNVQDWSDIKTTNDQINK